VNDNGARQSPAATPLDRGPDDTGPQEDIPVLIVAFPLEGKARALNAGQLTEAELVRVVDWLKAHNLGLSFDDWLDRHLVRRGIRP